MRSNLMNSSKAAAAEYTAGKYFSSWPLSSWRNRRVLNLDEIGLLLAESDGVRAYSGRWQRLAQSKRQELEALIASAQQMKERLEEGLSCHCQALDDCEFVLERTAQILEK